MFSLAKFKLNSVEVLIFKALIDLNISPNKFVLKNNAMTKFDNMKV